MAEIETLTHPRLNQVDAYRDLQEELESAYAGRWVIIHDCKCVGDYGSYNEAVAAADEMGIDILDCYIRQVGVEPALFIPTGVGPPIIIGYGR